MNKITLKKLLQKFKELGFSEIIIPESGKGFGVIKIIENKKMLEKMETARIPFYLCNGDKCLKIKNRKRRFVLPNGTIPKSCNHCLNVKNLFKLLFNEEYISYNTLVNEIKNNNNFTFDLKLFIDNIKNDIDSEFSYSYTPETKNNFSIIFKKPYTKSESDKIYNYFKEYKEILKRIGFDLEIEINFTIMLMEEI